MSDPDPTNAASALTAPVGSTPHGTPVVLPGLHPLPGAQPTLSAEATQLLSAALSTMPPGAAQTLLRQNWGWVVALLTPLLLTTWTNIKQIWTGPQDLAAISKAYGDDHQAVGALKGQVDDLAKEVKASEESAKKAADELSTKIDHLSWYLQHPGSPSSQP